MTLGQEHRHQYRPDVPLMPRNHHSHDLSSRVSTALCRSATAPREGPCPAIVSMHCQNDVCLKAISCPSFASRSSGLPFPLCVVTVDIVHDSRFHHEERPVDPPLARLRFLRELDDPVTSISRCPKRAGGSNGRQRGQSPVRTMELEQRVRGPRPTTPSPQVSMNVSFPRCGASRLIRPPVSVRCPCR